MTPPQDRDLFEDLLRFFPHVNGTETGPAPAPRDALVRELTALVTRLTRPLFRKRYGDLRQVLQTDDVVQEVLLDVLKMHALSARTEGEFLALLRTIIQHTLIDLVRKHFGPQGWGRNVEGGSLPPDPATTDHRALRDARIDVWEQVSKLPEEDGNVLLLRYWCGMEIREIAAVVGKDRGTIRNRLRGILERLSTPLTS